MYSLAARLSSLSRPRLLLLGLVLGFVAGALFGTAFGALASLFHNGPALHVGVRESWAWFAAAGSLMGAGWLRALPHR